MNNLMRNSIVDIAMSKSALSRFYRFCLAFVLAMCSVVLSISSVSADPTKTVTYYHNNLQGSPFAASYENGKLWEEQYSPYGYRVGGTGGGDAKALNDIGYTGHVEEKYLPNQLIYAKGRFYDPTLGRFLSIDPVDFYETNPQSFNRYAYADNNPYKYVDPDGQLFFLAPALAPLVKASAVFLAKEAVAEVASRATGGATDFLSTRRTAKKGFIEAAELFDPKNAQVVKRLVVPKSVTVSKSRFPESAKHIEDAVSAGKPNNLTINRSGAAANRRDSLRGVETKPGLDRDEFPPAMFQEGGKGASVRHINPSDNRGAGACIGAQCRGLSDGTRVRIDVVD